MRPTLFLLLALVTPLAGQNADETRRQLAAPVIVMVPENYPGFDPAVRDSHPEAVELYAVVHHREFDPETGEPTTVVLLNPARADAGTLREALVYVHNFRARGSPADAHGMSVVASRPRPLPTPMRRALAPRIRELMRQPVEEFGHLGEGRRIVLENPSAIVAPHVMGSR